MVLPNSLNGHADQDQALRHEVVPLPAFSTVDYESIGCPSSDSGIGETK
jgi:hypothetical protein